MRWKVKQNVHGMYVVVRHDKNGKLEWFGEPYTDIETARYHAQLADMMKPGEPGDEKEICLDSKEGQRKIRRSDVRRYQTWRV